MARERREGRGGFRRRLVIALVGLVALTAAVLGAGAYAFTAYSLREQARQEAVERADFAIAVLAPQRLSAQPTREEIATSGIDEAFRLRGASAVAVDFGDADPYGSSFAARDALGRLTGEVKAIVAQTRLGWQRVDLEGEPFIAVGARYAPGGPDFYLFFSTAEVESALDLLARALLLGGVVLTLLAALAARVVARGVLGPVRTASAAARRIERGDLRARVPVESRDEFGAWGAAFNRMAASLERNVRALREAEARERRFVADVSHELRTPLTALVTEAGILREHLDALPPDARRVAELLVADVARMRVLVDDLLEISRLEADADGVSESEFDLAAFVRSVVATRVPGATVRVSGMTMPVHGDRRRLERIVGNLVDNARDHGEARDVEVEAGIVGGEAVITVADRGPGVPAEDLPRLFDRFYKGDPSRRRGGSGLGLAIAREHARLLAGSLTAELRPGGGLRFELRFPVTRSLPASDGSVNARVEAAQPPPTATEPLA
jgi:two-component system sensor histidine kinase MtrB